MAAINMTASNGSGKTDYAENVFTPISQDKFDPNFLDRVRDRNLIETVIGETVQLKRSGSKSQVGLCPFHGGRTPSFHVYKQHYHCFGCGAHGDAFDFLIMRDNLSFPQSVQALAERAGMQMPGIEAAPLTAEDQAARLQRERDRDCRIEAEKTLRRLQDERREAAIAEMAEGVWAGAASAPANHPYLVRKGIAPHGMRVSSGGDLLIDMRDPDGKLWNLQSISGSGKKITLWHRVGDETEGGRMLGLSHVIGDLDGAAGVVVVEGVATGASVHEATGMPVVVAFTSGNLAGTTRELRAQFPEFPIIVAADNDHRKERLDPPKPNTGMVSGQAAVKGMSRAMVLAPTFQPNEEGKDWNDYAGVHGTVAVQVLFGDAVARLTAKAVTVAKAARVGPPPLPDGLLDVDGALGEFVAYVMATSISPQPLLAVGAGLAAIGALAGRRYRTQTDLRTNIYVVGIADSGGGKDHARKKVKALFVAGELIDYLGGEEIASGSGILTSLKRFPCRLFQVDEFGDWLASLLGKNAGAHKKQIADYLRTLYSSASELMTGAEYADQSEKGKARQDLQQPHACVYGTTTPGQFWNAIAGASVRNGLLPRFLVCITPESYPERVKPADIPLPTSLIERFQAIARGVPQSAEGNLGWLTSNPSWLMSSDTVPNPYLVPETPEAQAAIAALGHEEWSMLSKSKDDTERDIWARFAENSIKVALVLAVSRTPEAPVIEKKDVDWGGVFVRHTMATLLSGVERHVADSDYERCINKCLDVLRKAGKPLTEYEMVRKGFKFPEKERAEVLRTMVGSGHLLVLSDTGHSGGGGRPTIRYAIQQDGSNEG